MNRSLVDPIANAVLYEGYILYPYRPSIKNRQRWTFGGLYPEAHCQRQGGSDAPSNQTECLVQGGETTQLEAVIRFLHLTSRQVGVIDPPIRDWPSSGEPPFQPTMSLRVGEELFQTWQEAEEREIPFGPWTLGDLVAGPQTWPIQFPSSRRSEPLRGEDGRIVGLIVREQERLQGQIDLAAAEVASGLYRLTLRITNRASLEPEELESPEPALRRCLISTHAILGIEGEGGAFLSLTDPPEEYRELAEGCQNIGVWPVLVGSKRRAKIMLSSPIILYDDPQIAPESPGDFFDGTEIDELLTLRIQTLTDSEKDAMAALDARARALLDRTESLDPSWQIGLHGTFRGLWPGPSEGASSR